MLLPTHGLIRVSAQTGIITERRVGEGQQVQAGHVLFVLNSGRASATRGDTELTISALLQSRRDSLSTDQAQQRIQSTQRVVAAQRRAAELAVGTQRIDEQIALQQRRAALAEDALKRYTDLHASSFVSSALVQDRQAELLDQRQRVVELQRSKAANARDIAAVQSDVRDQQVQAKRDQQAASRNIASLDQDLIDNETRREIHVRAPQDGTVTAIAADLGHSVAGNQTLASILPADSELEAELYAPSRSVGFVKSGMAVLLRYQSFPYQKFGQFHGVVREVSSTTLRPEEMVLAGATLPGGVAAEPLYRVRVRLEKQTVKAYGIEQALKSGMALEASVLLEKRRLYEWVLDPVYSISGRL